LRPPLKPALARKRLKLRLACRGYLRRFKHS
jgi:hypothetical protein